MATQPQPQEIQIYQPDAQVGDLKLWRPPEQVLIEAQQVATALKKRIAGKEKPVIFNNQQYIENDDWQFVANFFGYAPKVISTEFVEYGDVQGFKAIAELINERTGQVVGRGEAICLDEEENWGPRTKYEWQDVLDDRGQKIWDPKVGKNGRGAYRRERVAVGEVDTPLFQLMSMAETRACNKAMSNKLKWVVTLAGYSATPAEDMHEPTMQQQPQQQTHALDDLPTEIKRKPVQGAQPSGAGSASSAPIPTSARTTESRNQRPAPEPRRQSAPVQTRSPQPQREQVISEPQSRRFYAIWNSAGKTKEEVNHYLREELGIQSDRDIPVSRYKEACAWAERSQGERW